MYGIALGLCIAFASVTLFGFFFDISIIVGLVSNISDTFTLCNGHTLCLVIIVGLAFDINDASALLHSLYQPHPQLCHHC